MSDPEGLVRAELDRHGFTVDTRQPGSRLLAHDRHLRQPQGLLPRAAEHHPHRRRPQQGLLLGAQLVGSRGTETASPIIS
jgi:hypothetical protein